MVMEDPSPQCVGREFVRQYYTMMHEAPVHLHRFYSHNSKMVHGGVEKPGEEQPPLIGQQAIHEKILSLSYNDCHAKIRQVDSQATLGNGIVVQVTGELSNNGEPMRRFMQTFVLAPQSTKKYYVANDVFRYQDEVFADTDSDVDNEEILRDSASDVEDVRGHDRIPEHEMIYDHVQEASPPLSNGISGPEDSMEASADDQRDLDVVSTEVEDPDLHEEIVRDNKQLVLSAPLSTKVELEPEQDHKPVEPAAKRSWAQLASTNKGSSPVAAIKPVPQVASIKPASSVVKPEPPKQQEATAPMPQRNQRPPRVDRVMRERDTNRPSTEGEAGDASTWGRLLHDYPDSKQLFIGNLPTDVSASELRQFFEKWGKVAGVKVNANAGGVKLPCFGFIGFDQEDVVHMILKQRPILFRGSMRINVEEKKQRGDRPTNGGGGGRFVPRGGAVGPPGPRRGGPPKPDGGRGGSNTGRWPAVKR